MNLETALMMYLIYCILIITHFQAQLKTSPAGWKSQRCFHSGEMGPGLLVNKRVGSGVCVRNYFLSDSSRRRAVAQRGSLAPAAAETQSLVGLAWCSQCCSSSPTVDPGLSGGVYFHLFSLPVQMELERWIIHVFERPLVWMKNGES